MRFMLMVCGDYLYRFELKIQLLGPSYALANTLVTATL